ncbi:glycosyltransferase [bacterium C-53]|nr:glycosyltransferase [Lachnospiraceae bacterium]NBI04689.1 glycosyltransferase [Lachnospiraceae bacterium]RKJ07911.1 glycosyltransferase [bacterium C-53]
MDVKDSLNIISVIVPVYNVFAYLGTCLDSIISQTYRNLEIILVDDGSTDGSGELCDKYAEKDDRICVVHKENGGLVSARKAGLARASGEFIGFVDSDDYIGNQFYEHLLQDILQTHADISQMGYVVEYAREKQYFHCLPGVFDISKDRLDYLCNGLILMKKKNFQMSCNVWSKLYKSELIQKAYAQVTDSQQYGEDFISTCSCLMECGMVSVISYAEYFYQFRENSISHTKPVDHMIQICHLYESVSDLFQNRNEYKKVKSALDVFFVGKMVERIEEIGHIHIPRYFFRRVDMLRGKKIVIYGVGSVGKDYYLQLRNYHDIEISAVADGKNFNAYFQDTYVVDGKEISHYSFDLILIAVGDADVAKEIMKELVSHGIHETSLYWEEPGAVFDFNRECCFA